MQAQRNQAIWRVYAAMDSYHAPVDLDGVAKSNFAVFSIFVFSSCLDLIETLLVQTTAIPFQRCRQNRVH